MSRPESSRSGAGPSRDPHNDGTNPTRQSVPCPNEKNTSQNRGDIRGGNSEKSTSPAEPAPASVAANQDRWEHEENHAESAYMSTSNKFDLELRQLWKQIQRLFENPTPRSVIGAFSAEVLPSRKGHVDDGVGMPWPLGNVTFDSELDMGDAAAYARYLLAHPEFRKRKAFMFRTCSVCREHKVSKAPITGLLQPPVHALRKKNAAYGGKLESFAEFGPPTTCCKSTVCNGCYLKNLTTQINRGFMENLDRKESWIRCPCIECPMSLVIRDQADCRELLEQHGSTSVEAGAAEFRNGLALRGQLSVLPPMSKEILGLASTFHQHFVARGIMHPLSWKDFGPKPSVKLVPLAMKQWSLPISLPVCMGLMDDNVDLSPADDTVWIPSACSICLEIYIDKIPGTSAEDPMAAEVKARFPNWDAPSRSALYRRKCTTRGRYNVCQSCMDGLVSNNQSGEDVNCPMGCGVRIPDEELQALVSPYFFTLYEAQRQILAYSNPQLRHGDIKECPNPECGVTIEKIGGCDEVTCGLCRFTFCWECLTPYRWIEARLAWHSYWRTRSSLGEHYEFVGDGGSQQARQDRYYHWLSNLYREWLDRFDHGESDALFERWAHSKWDDVFVDRPAGWLAAQRRAWDTGLRESLATMPTSNGHKEDCEHYSEWGFGYRLPGDGSSDDSDASEMRFGMNLGANDCRCQ